MDSLREFFVSSSGLAPVRQGLGLGWVISALTWVAILISPKEAQAGKCERRTFWDCSYNAWCDDYTDGEEPIRCCEITVRKDCSFSTGDCYCTA